MVRAGDVDWHLQAFGDDGPTVLMLHGTGASTHSWREVAPALAERTRVIAIDLPGHAATSHPGGDGMRLPGMARRLGALCRELAIEPDAIVGHSAGAAIGIAAALDALSPRLIVGLNAALQPMQGYALFSPLAKLLFVNPLAPGILARTGAREGRVRSLLDGTGTTLDDRGIELYGRLFADRDHVRGALGMMASWDLEWLQRRLPELRSRLVLLTAADDGTVPARDAPRHVARVRDGRLIALASGGHPVHDVRPGEIADRIVEELAAVGLPFAREAEISCSS